MAKIGYAADIEKQTIANTNFRKVVYTAKHSQLVLMSLGPGEEIGSEVHRSNDQFIRFDKGNGKVVINGRSHAVSDGSAVIIPAGAKHNVINTSKSADLKLYTLYSPPHHRDGIVRRTKKEAEEREGKESFDGKTTE